MGLYVFILWDLLYLRSAMWAGYYTFSLNHKKNRLRILLTNWGWTQTNWLEWDLNLWFNELVLYQLSYLAIWWSPYFVNRGCESETIPCNQGSHPTLRYNLGNGSHLRGGDFDQVINHVMASDRHPWTKILTTYGRPPTLCLDKLVGRAFGR